MQEPPQITFRKKEKGGVNLQCAVQQNELDLELVKVRPYDMFVKCHNYVTFRCIRTREKIYSCVFSLYITLRVIGVLLGRSK